MRATGSTRTATRWRSCSRAIGALVVVAASACITAATRYYVPSASDPRITPAEMRERVHAVLPLECPRLLAARDTVYGVVALTVFPDSAGQVRRARIDAGSGDARLDDLIGALAAQLQLPPPADVPDDRARRALHVSYSCVPHAALVRVDLSPR